MTPLLGQTLCPTRHAVILAAGESRRTRPLTLRRPKPLIPLLGKPLLSHILDELVGLVERVTLVVGYRAANIRACFGDAYRGMQLRYVRQQQVNGTAGALQAVAGCVNEPFFLLYGDNLISRDDVINVCRERYCMAALPVNDPRSFGILEIVDGRVRSIIEKPAEAAPGALANPGIYHFDAQVFQILPYIRPSPRGEYELTDLIGLLAQEHPVGYSLCTGHWIPVGTPWDALIASAFLLERGAAQPPLLHPEADIHPGCSISGAVRVGRARLGANCHIIGPAVIGDEVVIGAGCCVERSVLEAGVILGNNCSLTRSILGAGTRVGSDCTVQSSLLDDGASLGDRAHLPARRFDDLAPTAHTVGVLDRNVLCQRGSVLGPEVAIPADTTLEPGTVIQ